MDEIDATLASASVLPRLKMYPEQADLRADLEAMADKPDGSALETQFVEVAARYAASKGLSR